MLVQSIIDQAKKFYGCTSSWKSCGYLLPDGSLLDFSEGQGYRTLDHRNISAIYPGVHFEFQFGAVIKFLQAGAIRISPESGGICLIKCPTKEQILKLKSFVRYNDGEIYLDIIEDKHGDTIAGACYDEATPNRVVNDIVHYFVDGIKPVGDDINEDCNGQDILSVYRKEKQLEMILKNNPLDPTLCEHTWITSIDDIHTYQEVIQMGIDDGYDDMEYTPDYGRKIVEAALATGKITVYSSYPIKPGIFVTPSKMEAGSYAGSIKNVYQRTVNIKDVAWIDGLQGQYAPVKI